MSADALVHEGLQEMSDADLESLAAALAAERVARLVSREDPDLLVDTAMQTLHAGAEPGGPVMVSPSLLAVASVLRESSGGRHSCRQSTVRQPGSPDEVWCWDDQAPTYVHGQTQKVDGTRRSVDLHAAVEGLVVVRHVMTKKAGESHQRLSATATVVRQDVDAQGQITFSLHRVAGFVPGHLPMRQGEEDSRSAGARGR